MPVCSNCGGSDFVWAESLKTGGLGRGGLSLRSGGELALGTRVCRGCGHADLFVKDPTVLRQPHNWRPGEFVTIAPRPSSPAKPTPVGSSLPTAGPLSPAATSLMSPGIAPSSPASPMAPSHPTLPVPPTPMAPPASETRAPELVASEASASPEEGGPSPQSTPNKPAARRKGSKKRTATPPVIHE